MKELTELEILMSEFDSCVNFKVNNGKFIVECKLGLWSVETLEGGFKRILSEAKHYWQQYKEDGEYHEIIGGKSPVEILENKKGA